VPVVTLDELPVDNALHVAVYTEVLKRVQWLAGRQRATGSTSCRSWTPPTLSRTVKVKCGSTREFINIEDKEARGGLWRPSRLKGKASAALLIAVIFKLLKVSHSMFEIVSSDVWVAARDAMSKFGRFLKARGNSMNTAAGTATGAAPSNRKRNRESRRSDSDVGNITAAVRQSKQRRVEPTGLGSQAGKQLIPHLNIPCRAVLASGCGVVAGVCFVQDCKFKDNPVASASASHKCRSCPDLFHNLCGLRVEGEDEAVACSENCLKKVRKELAL
jgi:hypothetical protein